MPRMMSRSSSGISAITLVVGLLLLLLLTAAQALLIQTSSVFDALSSVVADTNRTIGHHHHHRHSTIKNEGRRRRTSNGRELLLERVGGKSVPHYDPEKTTLTTVVALDEEQARTVSLSSSANNNDNGSNVPLVNNSAECGGSFEENKTVRTSRMMTSYAVIPSSNNNNNNNTDTDVDQSSGNTSSSSSSSNEWPSTSAEEKVSFSIPLPCVVNTVGEYGNVNNTNYTEQIEFVYQIEVSSGHQLEMFLPRLERQMTEYSLSSVFSDKCLSKDMLEAAAKEAAEAAIEEANKKKSRQKKVLALNNRDVDVVGLSGQPQDKLLSSETGAPCVVVAQEHPSAQCFVLQGNMTIYHSSYDNRNPSDDDPNIQDNIRSVLKQGMESNAFVDNKGVILKVSYRDLLLEADEDTNTDSTVDDGEETVDSDHEGAAVVSGAADAARSNSNSDTSVDNENNNLNVALLGTMVGLIGTIGLLGGAIYYQRRPVRKAVAGAQELDMEEGP